MGTRWFVFFFLFSLSSANPIILIDPAFVAIMTYFMLVAAAGYMFAFRVTPSAFFKGLFYAIAVDWILVGVLAATTGWYISNNYLLLEQQGNHATEQKVEWQFCFDIHCNAFFPLFVLLYVVQYFILLAILRDGFVYTLLANGLYAFAFSYYFYITFLGYNVLPFLQHTTVFLYPIVVVLAVCTLCCLLRYNVAQAVMNWYFHSSHVVGT